MHELTDPLCIRCHIQGSQQADIQKTFVNNPEMPGSQMLALPLNNNRDCMPCHIDDGPKLGMVFVQQSVQPFKALIRTTQIGLLAAGTIFMLIIILSTRVLLGRYLNRPLKKLVQGAKSIGSGNFDIFINFPERTELSILADTFNKSADQLESNIQQIRDQRDFMMDLYHRSNELFREIQPKEKRKLAARIIGSIFCCDCLLLSGQIQNNSKGNGFHGYLTYYHKNSDTLDNPYVNFQNKEEIPFYSQKIITQWFEGEKKSSAGSIKEGQSVAYPLERRGRSFGIILVPACQDPVAEIGPVTDIQDIKMFRKHLAISLVTIALELSELQYDFIKQEKLAAIGETVAGLSHCLKNTLNGLRGGQYVVESAMKKNNQERLQQGWNVLKGGIRHIERLSLDMLYFTGDHAPQKEPININEILQEVIDLLSESASNVGVSLTLESDRKSNIVEIDRLAMYRVILNLVSNAIDACVDSEKGNSVILKSQSKDKNILILIIDNGVGMSQSTIKRMFERFFTTKTSKGTGLGLPVVNKLIAKHGGTIKVTSVLGEGTTFHLTIPK